MKRSPPPILKLTQSLRKVIEMAVMRFPRSHRYSVGSELRDLAKKANGLANRTWRDKNNALRWVTDLSWTIDELESTLQLAMDVRLFSFGEFEHLAKMRQELGSQVGGWKNAIASKSQNVDAQVPRQRAQILSSRTASVEANS